MAKKPLDSQVLKEFGDRVRSMRSERNLSQEQLAELADLDRTYISGVERGIRNISLINISAIATALNVPVAELTKGL